MLDSIVYDVSRSLTFCACVRGCAGGCEREEDGEWCWWCLLLEEKEGRAQSFTPSAGQSKANGYLDCMSSSFRG